MVNMRSLVYSKVQDGSNMPQSEDIDEEDTEDPDASCEDTDFVYEEPWEWDEESRLRAIEIRWLNADRRI